MAGEVYGGAAAIVVVLFVVWAMFLGLLWRWNKYGKKRDNDDPEHFPKWRDWKGWLEFFFAHILLDFIIGPIYTFYTIAQLTQFNYPGLQMSAVENAYFVFQAFKYTYLIAELLLEFKYHKLHEKISNKIGRPDWLQLLSSVLFIPLIIVDGFVINSGRYIGNISNIFNWDDALFALIDSVLWVKTMTIIILRNDSQNGKYQYDLISVSYSILSMLYTLLLIYCLVVVHWFYIHQSGMSLNPQMNLLLVSIICHPYISSFTSMIRQSIISLDKALKKTPNLRLKQIQIYIYYFRQVPSMQILNLACYIFAYYQYIQIYFLINELTPHTAPHPPALKSGVVAIRWLTYGINIFYMGNLVFGTCKRLGCYLGLKSPFDCTTYAQAMNTVLGECNTLIRMNTHMQT